MKLRHACCVLLLGLCGCGARAPAPADDALRVMPLGDSITEGSRRYNSYRRPLWHALREAGHRVDFVGSSQKNHLGGPPDADFDLDHEGHWGWTINQVLEQLDGWAQAANPDVVLIHLGTNDLFRGDDPETVVQELRVVVERLRAVNPRVALFIAELIPAKDSVPQFARLNEQIRALSALGTADSPVTIVDQFTGFDVAQHTYDGVHPNAEGEALIARKWFDALTRK